MNIVTIILSWSCGYSAALNNIRRNSGWIKVSPSQNAGTLLAHHEQAKRAGIQMHALGMKWSTGELGLLLSRWSTTCFIHSALGNKRWTTQLLAWFLFHGSLLLLSAGARQGSCMVDQRRVNLWNERFSGQLEHLSSPTHTFVLAIYWPLAASQTLIFYLGSKTSWTCLGLLCIQCLEELSATKCAQPSSNTERIRLFSEHSKCLRSKERVASAVNQCSSSCEIFLISFLIKFMFEMIGKPKQHQIP